MNNISSQDYEIRLARADELDQLQQFINDHWREGHVLAKSKEIMKWQHFDASENVFNFVIGKDLRSGQIHGILGFIPVYHFDKKLKKHNDIWMALWKVRDDVKAAGLGLSLLSYLRHKKKPNTLSACGLTKMVIPIYKYLRFETGVLGHYYIVNKKLNKFSLIGNFDGRYFANNHNAEKDKHFLKQDKEAVLEVSKEFSFEQDETEAPRKSVAYLRNRYFSHPVYEYDIYAVTDKERIHAYFVVREDSHGKNKAIRMVDFFGNCEALNGTAEHFQKLLSDKGAEYIDFYNFGMDERVLAGAGFIKRSGESGVIIPSHFEPFEMKNIELDCAYKCAQGIKHNFFKGDSDQDRPSRVDPPSLESSFGAAGSRE